MFTSILDTKLHIPSARQEFVPRSRLTDRLNDGLHRRGTLVSAPAGFGKTTLLREWIETLQSAPDKSPQGDYHIGWVSLDESDNDPTLFLTYFITALMQHAKTVTIGEVALSMLQSSQPAPIEAILTTLINEIAGNPVDLIIVLDDFHVIEAQSIHDALTFLLLKQPPQLHLVIATRMDPNLPLASLRAKAQLVEIRAADLRFTSFEAAEFLNRVMGLELSEENVSALRTRTEGWITGLQLAALAMQGREDTDTLIKSITGSHRFVLDYLMEEVLERQSEIIQTFMLQTSILNHMTGPLCDALTGREDGQQTLELLDKANLFVVPLDEERRWYRYHHLFGDLLLQRTRQNQDENVADLHTRASAWFQKQGMDRRAIAHSLTAMDYQIAATLIQRIAMDVMQQGEHTTVVGWINSLPEKLVKEQPYLCVLHAWAMHLMGEMEGAKARLIEAENALETLGDQDDVDIETILGLIHSQRAFMTFMTGELDKTIHHAQQALDQLPGTAVVIRTQTAMYQASAYLFQGQLQAAMEVYKEILPTIKRKGDTSTAVMCFSGLGDLYADMAQLHRAKDIYQQALDLSEKYNGRPDVPFTGYAYVRIGRILRQWNQLEDAHRYITKGLALCRDWNEPDVVALSCIELAYIQQALRNEEKSQDAIIEAYQIMEGFSPFGAKYAAAHQVYMNLARGDYDAAARWALKNELVLDGDFEFHREIEYLALARVLLAQKRFDDAQSLIERIYRIAQDIGRKHTELETLILLALVFFAQGETEQALVHLENALAISEPEGYIRIYVDEGLPMVRLLAEAFNSEIAPMYVNRLLTAFSSEVPGQAVSTTAKADTGDYIEARKNLEIGRELAEQILSQQIRNLVDRVDEKVGDITPSPQPLVEPLSRRELEVLQLIAKDLSNREIGERLFLALDTVKGHNRKIFAKLGVKNRTQAVYKAISLNILPPQ